MQEVTCSTSTDQGCCPHKDVICTHCWVWFRSVAARPRWRSGWRSVPWLAPRPQSFRREPCVRRGRCTLRIHRSSPPPHSPPQTRNLHPRRTTVHTRIHNTHSQQRSFLYFTMFCMCRTRAWYHNCFCVLNKAFDNIYVLLCMEL